MSTMNSNSLEVARCANVCLGQPLPFPFALFLPLGKGGVHNVVHLRVVMVTLNTVDLRVFDVYGGHGQRRTWKSDGDSAAVTVYITPHRQCIENGGFIRIDTKMGCGVFHHISMSIFKH